MIEEIGEISYGSKIANLKMWQVYIEGGERSIRDHRHINFEISLVLEGSGIYRTISGDKPINQGDVFVFPSNVPHCIINIEQNGLRLLNVQFSKQILDNATDLSEGFPYIFYNYSKNFNFKIKKENAAAITALLLNIRRELLDKNTAYSCAVTAAISEIFIELIRNHGYFSHEENFSAGIIRKLEKGIEYINAHYTEDITLSEIAEKSNITPNYFSKLFKECLNMKLWDYVCAKRIEKAKKLLSENEDDLTVLDIANQCGFNNTANFNRSFKLYTGMTPSEFRKIKYENIV